MKYAPDATQDFVTCLMEVDPLQVNSKIKWTMRQELFVTLFSNNKTIFALRVANPQLFDRPAWGWPPPGHKAWGSWWSLKLKVLIHPADSQRIATRRA
jgi:hypothetical protein